ncbi:MAG: 3-phosphoshikimate 1-carboxyvinyltransferase [Actinomycetota bacterium]
MELKIAKISGLRGVIKVPGDKSISHRALIIGSLTSGKTSILNFLSAADCLSTLACIQALDVRVEILKPGSLIIHGVGLHGLKEPQDVLNVGNSGTTLRVLPGVLAGQNFFSVLTGDQSIRRRPMDRVVDPLRQMGAQIWARNDGYAPIAILGRSLHGITYTMPISSAQVKTCLLLAGLLAEGKTIITEPHQSRDHTERMLKFLGADINIRGTSYSITGQSSLESGEISIPGDVSSTAFLIVGALITPQSELIIKDVGVNPTRTGALEVLKKMGAHIELEDFCVKSDEPRADILVKSSKLSGVTIGGEIIPRLVDELPVLAVAATQAEGITVVKDAQELRVKETDRISATCTNLRKLGADIEELEDGFIVKGPTKLKGTVCRSYGDHRMAMALSIAGLVAEGTTIIEGSECIDISFPGFEKALRDLIC